MLTNMNRGYQKNNFNLIVLNYWITHVLDIYLANWFLIFAQIFASTASFCAQFLSCFTIWSNSLNLSHFLAHQSGHSWSVTLQNGEQSVDAKHGNIVRSNRGFLFWHSDLAKQLLVKRKLFVSFKKVETSSLRFLIFIITHQILRHFFCTTCICDQPYFRHL